MNPPSEPSGRAESAISIARPGAMPDRRKSSYRYESPYQTSVVPSWSVSSQAGLVPTSWTEQSTFWSMNRAQLVSAVPEATAARPFVVRNHREDTLLADRARPRVGLDGPEAECGHLVGGQRDVVEVVDELTCDVSNLGRSERRKNHSRKGDCDLGGSGLDERIGRVGPGVDPGDDLGRGGPADRGEVVVEPVGADHRSQSRAAGLGRGHRRPPSAPESNPKSPRPSEPADRVRMLSATSDSASRTNQFDIQRRFLGTAAFWSIPAVD